MSSTTTSTTSAAHALHHSLLRPPILHILRAAGFHSTRPSVLETVVDLAARYLTLLASTTASITASNANLPEAPQLVDVRMAMQECGAFRPQLAASEELWLVTGDGEEEEDVRGVIAFVDWVLGEGNREIRRVAGMANAVAAAAAAAAAVGPGVGPGPAAGAKKAAGGKADIAVGGATGVDAVQAEGLLHGGEDFLTALKKKHSKTGEESRFQGTVLGKSAEDRPVKIEGGPVGSIEEWAELIRLNAREAAASSPSSSSTSLRGKEGLQEDVEMKQGEDNDSSDSDSSLTEVED
ncbi:MAG: hypothetical protein M1837_002597 [Sclerophora amabilis]|nr:MAG: hypothetical protein M1837_002597 [Sclerophora amabilis]